MTSGGPSWSGLGLGTSSSSVAVARGTIRIDIENSRNAVIQASKAMGDSIRQNVGGQTQQATRQAEGSLTSLNNTLAKTARAFAAAFGIRQAISAGLQVQRLNALFVVLTGSEEKATKELDKLRDLADRTGQPFLDMAEGATALLPVIGRTNVELADAVSIANRLALLDPAQGIQGASIAIRELLSGEVRSLAARFELSRAELHKLLEASDGDAQAIIDGLGEMVDEMGLTEEEFEKMGQTGFNSFAVLRSEMQETIAVGISPLLNNAIIPMVAGFGDALRAARELNPQLVELTTTLLGLAAAGQAAQLAGVPGGVRAGVLGAALFGGIQGGVAASRGLAELGVINRPDLENVSQQEAQGKILDTFKAAVVGAANALVNLVGIFALGEVTLGNAWNRAQLIVEGGAKSLQIGFLIARDAAFDFRDGALEAVNDLRDGLSSFLVTVGQLVPGRAGEALGEAGLAIIPRRGEEFIQRRQQATERQQGIEDAARELGVIAQQLQSSSLAPTAEQAGNIAANIERLRQTVVGGLVEALFPVKEVLDEVEQSAQGAADAIEESLLTTEMEDAFREFQDDLADIQDKAQQDRLEAVKDHEQAVTDATANFQRQRERAAEDEARRRAKAEQGLADNIAQAAAAGNKQIADLEAKAQEDTLKAEQDFQKRRQRQQRDMFRELRDAAASLDAKRVFEILQRGREQGGDERQQFDEEQRQRQREKEERIQEIRQQTQERIQGLRQQFQETEAEYAEQRRIRLAREQEDFNLQLAEMDRSHQERLLKIKEQAVRETQARNEAFIEQHNALLEEQGNHNERMINIQRTGTDALEQQYREWLLRMQQQTGTKPAAAQTASKAVSKISSGFKFVRAFQSGGRVGETGPIFAHAGEEVLPASVSDLLRRRAGGELSPANILQMLNVAGAANGGRAAQFGDIHNNINASGMNMTPEQLQRLVERAMIRAFERM